MEALSPVVRRILGDPAASWWLKDALLGALARDPVDALNDALALARALEAQLRAQLGNGSDLQGPMRWS